MNKVILYSILINLCLCGCRDSKESNTIYHCQVESQIEEYPDSGFFSNITCMTYSNGKVYALDKKRGDIVELTEDLKNMRYVCKHGEAPYETIMPLTFDVLNDTVYVVDLGTK